ncbi:MAG TPA: hypothetical protein VGM64_18750 [Lacunisphaera sp.]|jgi:hypothetical protein
MKFSRLSLLVALFFFGVVLSSAAELAGKWKADFDSQIGPQKYAYEFKVDAGKYTGKASYDHSMGKGDSVLGEIKLAGDNVSFVEKLNINDMDLTVTYTGKISGDEMKLTRVVGDFATEQIVAKRVRETDAKTAPAK